MDAGAEQDIELQRNAASYIDELKKKLPRFLFQSRPDGQLRVRTRVRASTTTRLCSLLEPFQEWPQLLDPHLPTLVGPLQDALRDCCRSTLLKRGISDNDLVQPLDFAVCKLLYTLCKVRGAKVISRFLDSSTENLELVLASLESKLAESNRPKEGESYSLVTWEEKYVYMLWIAHLLFAPFDLNTVGSSEAVPGSEYPSLKLALGLPEIAVRLVHVGLPHLGAASKAREAAVKLLCRLAARPDMISFGVHDSLFDHALTMLKMVQSTPEQVGPYDLIGCLSLLAGLLSTLKIEALKPYILIVFKHLLSLTGNSSNGDGRTITAVSRKLMVKNLRILSKLALQLASDSQPEQDSNFVDFILEESIDYLLTSVADQDTPVRQAASKAISSIVLSLDADLAGEVIDSVVGSLDENVLWMNQADQQIVRTRNVPIAGQDRESKRDLSAVNPLRWHGLVLTLAQLLFQRSAPPSQLPAIINSLVLALSFDQRVASGSSIGGNVRDAANFGIWSIARKYSTEELLLVQVESVRAMMTEDQFGSITVIQALAAELINAATLDPSGNIRRGSSAALQELIGRHPDMIFEGIPVVQVVDYHAISLRSKAFFDVAIQTARLHEFYWKSLLVAMMGWRGLEAADAPSRRLAATSISCLAQAMGPKGTKIAAQMIYKRLSVGIVKDVEKRHGLLLGAAALISSLTMDKGTDSLITDFWDLLKPPQLFHRDDLFSQTRRPEFTAEAVSEIVAALAQRSSRVPHIERQVDAEILDRCVDSLSLAMGRREQAVLVATAKAAKSILPMLKISTRTTYILQWVGEVDARLAAHDTGPHQGYILGLASLYGELDPAEDGQMRNRILATMFRALNDGPVDDVHTRVAALVALRQGIFQPPSDVTPEVVSILNRSLKDYTVDERGDIGSLVRLEAVEAARYLLKECQFSSVQDKETLLAQIAVLAGEKLDKLRFHAWNCLRDNWSLLDSRANEPPPDSLTTINQAGTRNFFSRLLDLLQTRWLLSPVLQGVCISAGAGSETVLRAARSALLQFLINASETQVSSVCTAMANILRENLSNDRVSVPMLDTWAYLLQSNLLNSYVGQDFSWQRLFVLVQRAHFKSGNIQKLTAAVHLYAILAEKDGIRAEVLKKIASMLLHPSPRVRNAAADAMFTSSPVESLSGVDWSKAPKTLKPMVDKIRASMLTNDCNEMAST